MLKQDKNSAVMSEPPVNVLFLCTHNSARSILAEATLNHIGQGRFKAWSAGSSPRASQQPNPLGLRALQEAGIPTQGLHSKSWEVFAGPEAPLMDLVITVCDNAAAEQCPHWPGHPATAHWSHADPSAVEGSDEQRLEAFRRTLQAIRERLERFVELQRDGARGAVLQERARELARFNS
jgi:arsenate reductase (thioredoxin)